MIGVERNKPVVKNLEEIKMLEICKCRHINIGTFHLEVGKLFHGFEDLLRLAEHLGPVGVLFTVNIPGKNIIQIELFFNPGFEFCNLGEYLFVELPAKVFSLPRPDGLQYYYPAMFAEISGIAQALYPVSYFRVEKDP